MGRGAICRGDSDGLAEIGTNFLQDCDKLAVNINYNVATFYKLQNKSQIFQIIFYRIGDTIITESKEMSPQG